MTLYGNGKMPMSRKISYVCDGCGTEFEDPPISMYLNRCDAVLQIKVHGEAPVIVVPEDGLLNFCNTRCLQMYFSRRVIAKEGRT